MHSAQFDIVSGRLLHESLHVVELGKPAAMKPRQLWEAGMYLLWVAELAAASVGIVKPIVTGYPDVPIGVRTLGEAGPLLGKAQTQGQREAAIVYRAAHGTLRAAHASVRKASPDSPRISGYDLYGLEGLAGIPAAVLITVGITTWGIASSWAAAWWARGKYDVEIEATKARAVASVTSLAQIAQMQLQTRGAVEPDIIEALRDTATKEATDQAVWPFALAGVGAGVAGTLGFAIWRGLRGNP